MALKEPFPLSEENLVAYANSFNGDTAVLCENQAVQKITATHVRMRDREAEGRRWFRSAPYWRRLLLTLSGYPW